MSPSRLSEIGCPAASSHNQRQRPPPSSLHFLWKVSAIPFVSCGWWDAVKREWWMLKFPLVWESQVCTCLDLNFLARAGNIRYRNFYRLVSYPVFFFQYFFCIWLLLGLVLEETTLLELRSQLTCVLPLQSPYIIIISFGSCSFPIRQILSPS